jgi:hypothetical protein
MSVLAQPPSDFSPDLLRHVRTALRKTGRLLPATEALDAIEERKVERSQPNLSDPYELFESGNSGGSAPARSETREDSHTTSPHQNEINESLALARNGDDEISPEVREQMEQDRKDQEDNSSDDQPEEPSDEEENDESDE